MAQRTKRKQVHTDGGVGALAGDAGDKKDQGLVAASVMDTDIVVPGVGAPAEAPPLVADDSTKDKSSDVKNWSVDEVVRWAKQAANLDDEDCSVLRKHKVKGMNLEGFTVEKLVRAFGLAGGPADALVTAIDTLLGRSTGGAGGQGGGNGGGGKGQPLPSLATELGNIRPSVLADSTEAGRKEREKLDKHVLYRDGACHDMDLFRLYTAVRDRARSAQLLGATVEVGCGNKVLPSIPQLSPIRKLAAASVIHGNATRENVRSVLCAGFVNAMEMNASEDDQKRTKLLALPQVTVKSFGSSVYVADVVVFPVDKMTVTIDQEQGDAHVPGLPGIVVEWKVKGCDYALQEAIMYGQYLSQSTGVRRMLLFVVEGHAFSVHSIHFLPRKMYVSDLLEQGALKDLGMWLSSSRAFLSVDRSVIYPLHSFTGAVNGVRQQLSLDTWRVGGEVFKVYDYFTRRNTNRRKPNWPLVEAYYLNKPEVVLDLSETSSTGPVFIFKCSYIDGTVAARHHPAGKTQVLSVCQQLTRLHKDGWVHGDIRPANVLFPKDSTTGGFLIDFDIARRVQDKPTYPDRFVERGLEIPRHADAQRNMPMLQVHDCAALRSCLKWWMTSLPPENATAEQLETFVATAEKNTFIPRKESQLFQNSGCDDTEPTT